MGDLSTLVGDFERSLRASNKTDQTVEIPVPPHRGASLLAEGGGETDLMQLYGWKSRQILGRYVRAFLGAGH